MGCTHEREEARPSLRHEAALRNAPAQANGLFMVPKIVELPFA